MCLCLKIGLLLSSKIIRLFFENAVCPVHLVHAAALSQSLGFDFPVEPFENFGAASSVKEKSCIFGGSEATFIPSTLAFKLLLAWLQSELGSGWDSEEPPQFLGVSSCWLETCDLADFIRLGFTSLAFSWGLLQAWISPKRTTSVAFCRNWFWPLLHFVFEVLATIWLK